MLQSGRRNLFSLLFLLTVFFAVSCGSSGSSDDQTDLANTGGTCVNNPGAAGSWEITSLDAATQWTRVCSEGGNLSASGKFLRFENLQIPEGESLSLMPFSNNADNGFLIRFSEGKMETGFSPLSSSQEPASFAINLTEAKTFCVEIHSLSNETHILGYRKGSVSAVCDTADSTDPKADWDVDSPARDAIGGLQLGYLVSGNVSFDKIVVTNRVGGKEAGNPSE